MRNVVVLSLAVLAIAFVPVLAPANAPIFIDVPGMITIYESGGNSVYVNSFGATLDASVYDPDNADADLSWTFDEPAAAAGAITVNGQGPGGELRVDANSTFDVTDNTHASSGVLGIVAADYANTNAAAPIAAAGTATKITVQCSDGTHQTEKDILIISNTGAGTNANNGIGGVVPNYSFATGTDYNSWGDEVPAIINTGGDPTPMTFANIAGGLQIATTIGDNVDNDLFLISQAYMATKIGPGYNQLGAGAVDVQQGKMYLMTTNVSAAGVAVGDAHDSCKYRLRAGTINSATFDIQSLYVNAGNRQLFPASRGQRTPWWIDAGTHSATYHNMFVPPQEARFSGIGWGGAERNYRMFFDVLDIDGYNFEGSLTFGATQLEELDRPGVGDNGYLAAWGAGATPFNEYKPMPETALASDGALGWNYHAARYTAWGSTGVKQNHQDITPGSGITDLATTATFDYANPNQVGIMCAGTGFHITGWQIGVPNGNSGLGGAYPFNDSSAIDYATEKRDIGDLVWYRATVSMTDGDGVSANNPQFRLRFGEGFSTIGQYLVIGSGALTTAGPDLDPTVYEVWFRAPDSAQDDTGQPALNNLELVVQMLDDSDSTGDTYTITDVRIECFPVDYFDN